MKTIQKLKTILITGGAGYIGSHCCLAALNAGYNVICLDSLERGYMEAVTRVEKLSNKKMVFIKCDLKDKDSIIEVFENNKIDLVIHFAAYKSVGEGQSHKQKYNENNVGGSNNLLAAMKVGGCKNIIFSSTAAVYGDSKVMPVTETTPTLPMSVYGQNKLDTEKNIQSYCVNEGFKAIAFRYFNVVGNDQSGDIGEDPSQSTNLLPVLLQTIKGERVKTQLFGDKHNTNDGTQERDYIDVVDLVNAHILGIGKIESDITPGELKVINLSTSKATSCKQMIDYCENITGKKLNLEVIEKRDGDPDVIVADNKLAVEYLGWKVKNSVENSIENQWKWVEKNPKGYSKIS